MAVKRTFLRSTTTGATSDSFVCGRLLTLSCQCLKHTSSRIVCNISSDFLIKCRSARVSLKKAAWKQNRTWLVLRYLRSKRKKSSEVLNRRKANKGCEWLLFSVCHCLIQNKWSLSFWSYVRQWPFAASCFLFCCVMFLIFMQMLRSEDSRCKRVTLHDFNAMLCRCVNAEL